jgi:hypothetical protein
VERVNRHIRAMQKIKKVVQKTIHSSGLIDKDVSKDLYKVLRDNIPWEDGIPSKNGFTRKAYSISVVDFVSLLEHVDMSGVWVTLQDFILQNSVRTKCSSIYLNYYQDGEMYTPNHTHRLSSQCVLSLGCPRTLNVGENTFEMKSGDAIIFGSSVHGVKKQSEVKKGRISIAVFLQ